MTQAPTPTPQGDRDLRLFWYGGDQWRSTLNQDLIPAFTDDRNVSVDYSVRVGHEREWLGAARQAIEADDPFEIYASLGLEFVSEFLARGQLQTHTDLVNDLAAANGELLVGPAIRSQGEAYLVPHEVVFGGVLHYRTDIYQQLGLSVPDTWDGLLENARAIDESEQIEARGFAVSAPDREKAAGDFTNWFYNAGGQYFRWADEGQSRVEVDFDGETVRATLEFMCDLSEYSPDPSEQTLNTVRQNGSSGVVAQCLFPSTHIVQFAHLRGEEQIALNTRQTLVPRQDSTVSPIDRGWVDVGGGVTFDGANRRAAADFHRFMFEGPEQQAEMNLVSSPMWGLPPYREVLETDTYRKAELFTVHDGYFLDLQRHCLDEIAPHHASGRPRTPAAYYALNGDAIVTMVHEVVARGEDTDAAIARARRSLSSRLEDGREIAPD